MASVNEVVLVGRLGKDPEELAMTNGKLFCKLRIATSKRIGEEEVTQWHGVTVFNEKDAKFALDYMKTGALVFMRGELQYSQYESEGRTIYRTDIIVGGWGHTLQLLADAKPKGEAQPQSTRRKYGDKDDGLITRRASDIQPVAKPGKLYTDEQRAADRAEFDDDIPF